VAFDHVFLGRKVDLVLSGINHGSNAAVNVMYSGTMGAAIEGSFYNVPSIGLSVDDHDADADFDGAVEYGRRIISAVLDAGDRLPRPLCLNVNVPRCKVEEIQGIRLSRQTRGFWREEFYERKDPYGRGYFWLTGAFQNAEPEAEDTDEWALAHRYVSVVPVQTDMTDYRQLAALDGVL
jgi:5'-nucleotidase